MPENSTPTTPETGQRVSVGEIAAFVAESNRFISDGGASVRDRLQFFEWKVDLFTRLTGDEMDESVVVARAQVERLCAELAGQGAA